MRRIKVNRAAVAMTAVCLGLVPPALGTVNTTTFAFEGVVDSLVDFGGFVYPHLVKPGDILSGTCTLDLTVPDTEDPDWPVTGEYRGAVIGFEGQVGGLSFSLATPTTSVIKTVNDGPPIDFTYPGLWDRYIQGTDVLALGHTLRFGMTLMDYLGTALSSEAIPAVMPPLAAFHDRPGGSPEHPPPFHFAGLYQIFGTLTAIQTIPEPTTLLCLSIGGVALITRRKVVR